MPQGLSDIFFRVCLPVIKRRYTPEVGEAPGRRLITGSNLHAVMLLVECTEAH